MQQGTGGPLKKKKDMSEKTDIYQYVSNLIQQIGNNILPNRITAFLIDLKYSELHLS